MKILFQTGTVLTSENMNLAHLATGNPGVLSGCDVYLDDDYIKTVSGCVQFKDGTIVYLDGSDKIKYENFAHNEYYAYVVRYGNDYAFEVSIMLPEDYEYITLAEITILDINNVQINNVKKSTIYNQEKIIDGYALHPDYIVHNEFVTLTFSKDYSTYSTFLKAFVNGEGWLSFPFTYPNFNINKIKMKASLSSDTTLKLSVLCNGEVKYVNEGVLTNIDFDEDEHTFDLKSALKNVKNGDICSIKINLGQTINEENVNSDINIYSLLLQT